VVFAYPGGTSMPIHQALSHVVDRLRTILPRHEQGGGFAAYGYARSSGKVGVCVATSGPGATNFVTCLANAQRDAVPLLALTGQVNTTAIGTDAFQEIPIVGLCRTITKHHYQARRVHDVARMVKEALHLAVTGRPGPVLVDLPKNVQIQQTVPHFDESMHLPGYRAEPWPTPSDSPAPSEAAPLPALVLDALSRQLSERNQLSPAILTTSAGGPSAWVARSSLAAAARNWIRCHGLGALGFALPAAIGAQAAHPDRLVIAIDDASGFLANVHELACAYCEKLPVKMLVVHDHPRDPDPDLAPDFATVARGFRAGARSVERFDELEAGLATMLDSNGPFVLDLRLPVPAPVVSALTTTSGRRASVPA
jgi:thiamine pyrophosphate-dependent acetolactate synthase large subunit-like protein